MSNIGEWRGTLRDARQLRKQAETENDLVKRAKLLRLADEYDIEAHHAWRMARVEP